MTGANADQRAPALRIQGDLPLDIEVLASLSNLRDAGWPHFAGHACCGYPCGICYCKVRAGPLRVRTSYEGQCRVLGPGKARNKTRSLRCRRASKPSFFLACSPSLRRVVSKKKKLSWSNPSRLWLIRYRASTDFFTGRVLGPVRRFPTAASRSARP